MPVVVAAVSWPVAVVAAVHDVADSCLLVAIIVVVGGEHGAEAVDGGFVLVTEVVGKEFEVGAIGIASPHGACLAIGAVGAPDFLARLRFLVLAVGREEVLDTLIADAEVELAIGAEMDAMDAVIVIDAIEAGEEDFGWAIGFAIAILVFKQIEVRRMADINLVPRSAGIPGNSDAKRGEEIGRLIEGGSLVSFAIAIAVFEDDNAVSFGANVLGAFEKFPAVVDRFANPDPAPFIDIHTGGVREHRLAGEELQLHARRHLEGTESFVGGKLSVERG